MKNWIAASLFTLLACPPLAHAESALTHGSYENEIYGDDDVLPWPWGTECPFPWEHIEGVWKTSRPAAYKKGANGSSRLALQVFYEFKVTNMRSSESKLVEITKYDSDGQVVGTGRGYSHPNQKIVRAVIIANQGVEMANHRVIVRAYKQKSTLSCGSELVTVLTTRSMDNQSSSDRHYVLKKVPADF